MKKLLIFAVALCMLCGCSKTSEEKNTSTAPQNTIASTTTVLENTTTTAPETTIPKITTTTEADVTDNKKIDFDIDEIETRVHVDIGYCTAGEATMLHTDITDKVVKFFYDCMNERIYNMETDEAYENFEWANIVPTEIKVYDADFSNEKYIYCSTIMTGIFNDEEWTDEEVYMVYNVRLEKFTDGWKVSRSECFGGLPTKSSYIARDPDTLEITVYSTSADE